MTTKDEWIWMPHAGHFAAADYCRFKLNTYLGNGYLVSTVGEWFPDSAVREIFASVDNITLEGKGDAREDDYMRKMGFHDLGYNRKYETMVFAAKKADDEHVCCPYRIDSYEERDMEGYNDSNQAYLGHMMMCEKWSRE